MDTQTALPTGVTTASKQEKVVIDVSNFPTMEEVERQYLNLVLERNGGSKADTAKVLGLSVKTIYNKLDSYKANGASEALRSNT